MTQQQPEPYFLRFTPDGGETGVTRYDSREKAIEAFHAALRPPVTTLGASGGRLNTRPYFYVEVVDENGTVIEGPTRGGEVPPEPA